MEDLQKTDPLYYEHILIQNELHKLISLINEANISAEEKAKLKEKTYQDFLTRAKQYKGCLGFQTMTVEELKVEYEKFTSSLKKQDDGR